MGKKARNRARRVRWADEDDEINPESDTCLPRRSGPIGFGDPSLVDQLNMDRRRLPTLNKLVSTESERDVSNDVTHSLAQLDSLWLRISVNVFRKNSPNVFNYRQVGRCWG